MEYFDIKKLISENGWGGVSVISQLQYLKEHEIKLYELTSRDDIVKATKNSVSCAKEEVIILGGDRDDARDPEVSEIYARKVPELGKENMKFMMNIEGWNLENAKTILNSGVSVRHVSSDVRAGVIDDNMFAFYRTSIDPDYTKYVGTTQRQDEKMKTVGYITDHKPFVKKMKAYLQEKWEIATPAEEVISKIETLREPTQESL
ncbi:MAG: hypothetical protein KJ697_01160 [Nanoarchaeota archaeon]|nr:hypothetical protein [Nanoarchaeota archaeon]MBU4123855.1 hypothetical protein [Nanoarchaeota archaeon]